MKKPKPEYIEWQDLKVGDFVESKEAYLFCYSIGNPFGGPSCLGRGKPKDSGLYNDRWLMSGGYKRFYPPKSFIALCKKLLKDNLQNGHVDNLSYIEALAALKKYETSK